MFFFPQTNVAAESVLIGLGKTQQCERCFFVTAVCDDLYGTYIHTHSASLRRVSKQTNKQRFYHDDRAVSKVREEHGILNLH